MQIGQGTWNPCFWPQSQMSFLFVPSFHFILGKFPSISSKLYPSRKLYFTEIFSCLNVSSKYLSVWSKVPFISSKGLDPKLTTLKRWRQAMGGGDKMLTAGFEPTTAKVPCLWCLISLGIKNYNALEKRTSKSGTPYTNGEGFFLTLLLIYSNK